MTKNEYLERLGSELKKKKIVDMEEVLEEYAQHFACRAADGYAEEETAARLGAPEKIAAQFEACAAGNSNVGGRTALKIGLGFVAFFEALGYLLLFAFVLVLGAAALCMAVAGVCLLSGQNIASLLPALPLASALIFGVCLLALAALMGAATCYFFAFDKQLARAGMRWHRNVLSGGMLPPLPLAPQFSGKARRALRAVLLFSAAVFGVTAVLGMIVSAILAGAVEFWHAWNWFV